MSTPLGIVARGPVESDELLGRLDTSWLPTVNNTVQWITEDSTGRLLVTGQFTIVNDQTRTRFVRFDSAREVDSLNAAFNNTVRSVIEIPNTNDLIVGGIFTTAQSQSRPNWARLNSEGMLLDALPACDNQVISLQRDQFGHIIAAGTFRSVGGSTRNRAARLTDTYSLDAAWNPNLGSFVNRIVLSGAEQVYLAGAFTTIAGIGSRTRFARFNTTPGDTGAVDSAFLFSANGNGTSAAPGPDGSVYVAGWFSTVGTSTNWRYITRNIASGNVDTTFSPQNLGFPATTKYINDLWVQPDGKIIVGGNFDSIVGGVTKTNLMRVNPDGTRDDTFTCNVTGGAVNCIYYSAADKRLYIGGGFTAVNGVARVRLARIK